MAMPDAQRIQAHALRLVERHATLIMVDRELRVTWAESRFHQRWPDCVGRSLTELTAPRVPGLMLTKETLLQADGGVLPLTLRAQERGVPTMVRVHPVGDGLLLLLLPLADAELAQEQPETMDVSLRTALRNILQDHEQLHARHEAELKAIRSERARRTPTDHDLDLVAAGVRALAEPPAQAVEMLLGGIGRLLAADCVLRLGWDGPRRSVEAGWREDGAAPLEDFLASRSLSAALEPWRAGPDAQTPAGGRGDGPGEVTVQRVPSGDDGLRAGLGLTRMLLMPCPRRRRVHGAVAAFFRQPPEEERIQMLIVSPTMDILLSLLRHAEGLCDRPGSGDATASRPA